MMSIQIVRNWIYNTTHTPSSLTLFEYAKKQYAFESLPREVWEALEKASHSEFINEPKKKALMIDPSYQMTHLSKKALIQLHEVISCYYDTQKSHKSPFFIHLFDIEDHIFRQVVTESELTGHEYIKLLPKDSPLAQKIDDLLKNGSRFYHLEPNSMEAIRVEDFHIPKTEPKRVVNQQKPLKVLKIAVENARNFSGGIAGVVVGLASAHKKLRALNPTCAKVYSFSPLYEKEKDIARDFTFQGILTHFYEGQTVQSSIYKNKESLEYLLQPDPSFARIFNTPTTKAPYSDGVVNRLFYLASAAAAFAAFYKGKTGDRQIQILQSEQLSIIAGCALSLLHSLYTPIRESSGFKEKTRTIVVWHHGDVGYQSLCHPKDMALLGAELDNKNNSDIDLVKTGLAHADKVIYVSKELALRATDPNPAIHKGNQSLLLEPHKVVSIRNGVECDKFDPTEKATFKSLALERTFDVTGTETTDYSSYRKKLKSLLYEANILKDPDLPLATFVGRYSKEKGIETLADMIEHSPPGLQFVCMGLGSTSALDHIKQMETTTHQNRLSVITTFEEQNMNFSHAGKNYEIPVGTLIRAAADCFIVPSYIEACGLVAMEGQCSGGLLIAPFHQGLKDICKAEGYPSSESTTYSLNKDANAICYQDPFDLIQARKALIEAFTILTHKTEKERNQLAIRIRNEALSSYSWYHLDLPKKTATGGAISYDSLYHDMTERPRPTSHPISLCSEISEIHVPSLSKKTNFFTPFMNIFKW